MKTVSMNIANGYLTGELRSFKEARPTQTEAEATAEWVNQRYGSWITSNLTEAFTIREVTGNSFRIEFQVDADAATFCRTVGGVCI